MNIKQEEIKPKVVDSSIKNYRGFTLIAPVGVSNVYLLDMRGRVVDDWTLPTELGSHAVLLPNKNLFYAASVPKGPLGDFDGALSKLLEVNGNGKIVWQYEDSYMHHDFCRLPNGNTVFLRWVPTPKDIAAKVQGGLPDTEREGTMWGDSLREVDPAGKVVWEWLGYERLGTELDIICPLCFRDEWTRAKSFAFSPDGNNILVSFFGTNSIAIINKETGNIDWRWGGFRKLAHPNSVSWMNNEDVMVLGCGGHSPGFELGMCEILLINVETSDIVWQFKEPSILDFYTPYRGNIQQLPNGNVLVCEGDRGRIFELTEDKDKAWEFVGPTYCPSSLYGNSSMIFRAYRYGPDYEGLKKNVPGARRAVPVEKAKPSVEKAPKAKPTIEDRLSALGY